MLRKSILASPMKSVLTLLAAFTLFAALGAASAQGEGAQPYVIPFTTMKDIKAQSNGVNYRLYIRTPPDYETSDEGYPVMVLLDADYSFSIAVNHVEHLADRGQAPDMIIVAIAYPDVYPDRRGYAVNRSRDYTPVFVEHCCYGPEFQKASGGGPAFRDFIADELFPYLDKTYRTNGDRVYVGHSFGGLFGAFTLLTRPEIFTRYILVSGSYWYGDDYVIKLAGADKLPALEETKRVYMGVGSWENQQGVHLMVDDQMRFEAALKNAYGRKVVVKSRVFEDETHASIFPAVLSTGLRHVYVGDDETDY